MKAFFWFTVLDVFSWLYCNFGQVLMSIFLRSRMCLLMSCFVLAAFLGACGSETDGNNETDSGTTETDSGQPDTGDSEKDAAPDATQEEPNVGAACNDQQPCAGGAECLSLFEGSAEGFCTVPCSTPGEVDECGEHYDGPGTAYCGPNQCLIACGADNQLPETCPDGLACIDVTGPADEPNGLTDLCSPLAGIYMTLLIDDEAVEIQQATASKNAEGRFVIQVVYNTGGNDGVLALGFPTDAAPGTFDCSNDDAGLSYQWPAAVGETFNSADGCEVNVVSLGEVDEPVVGTASATLQSTNDSSTSEVRFTFATFRGADE